ncbi:hypothetical protein FHX81_7972 [Saccharothrix saharensis]|uniref:Uncharacterized protein n=1 Tax=Saccharothrix saharensis TaxID=571190 RepID=A0A543JRK6_9PSEU|nr:hypothetical protein FHX81_7972 [Saccharothrix saharensis]
MAKTVVIDVDRLDREAHELFRQLTPGPSVGQDKEGRTVTIPPGERFVEITRRLRIIAVSDTLARAVTELLARGGHSAAIGHVQVDPAAEGDEQVLGLLIDFRGSRAVVPLRPGARQLRIYPEIDGIHLTGHEPLLTIELPAEAVEQDGWIKVDSIVAALAEHLSPAA